LISPTGGTGQLLRSRISNSDAALPAETRVSPRLRLERAVHIINWLNELTADCPRKHYIRLRHRAWASDSDNAALTLSLCRKADIVKTAMAVDR
jgi:hypothetical protein